MATLHSSVVWVSPTGTGPVRPQDNFKSGSSAKVQCIIGLVQKKLTTISQQRTQAMEVFKGIGSARGRIEEIELPGGTFVRKFVLLREKEKEEIQEWQAKIRAALVTLDKQEEKLKNSLVRLQEELARRLSENL